MTEVKRLGGAGFDDYRNVVGVFLDELKFICGKVEETGTGDEGTLSGFILKLAKSTRGDLAAIEAAIQKGTPRPPVAKEGGEAGGVVVQNEIIPRAVAEATLNAFRKPSRQAAPGDEEIRFGKVVD